MSTPVLSAEIKDALIQKFANQQSYTWEQMFSDEFRSSLPENSDHLQYHLQWLIDSHIIYKDVRNHLHYKLTPYATKFIRHPEKESFVAREQREKAKREKEQKKKRQKTIFKYLQWTVLILVMTLALFGIRYASNHPYEFHGPMELNQNAGSSM